MFYYCTIKYKNMATRKDIADKQKSILALVKLFGKADCYSATKLTAYDVNKALINAVPDPIIFKKVVDYYENRKKLYDVEINEVLKT